MSGAGQKRRFGHRPTTSGVPQSTDIARLLRQVRLVSLSDSRVAPRRTLFDDVVSPAHKRRRDAETERLSGFHVDY